MREGHTVGLTVEKEGWALGRQQWQKGSRLGEDGEQWAGRLAGTLGGAFEGAPWPSTPWQRLQHHRVLR